MIKKQILFFALSLTVCGNAWSYQDIALAPSIQTAFQKQQIQISSGQVESIRDNVRVAVETACRYPGGNSKVGFSAVEIATTLGLNPKLDSSLVDRIKLAINDLASNERNCRIGEKVDPSWPEYFRKTVSLTQDQKFLSLVSEKKFSPVKISWEDIGRYENSVWGDRISDVGIWVRKDEVDPKSAELALSVRRDENFRDKILVVPADKIKIHTKLFGVTREISLPERLKELGLNSQTRDKSVIVSNQFAIVPVPSYAMKACGEDKKCTPPRAAFNFSILPYGSTNFVITDVIEGSSNAVVGPGNHQLLFANINGQKAPFTASRAEDRSDLLKLEADLKSQGMDVDVQRYYLIQIPLKKDSSIQLSNMGTPPSRGLSGYDMEGLMPAPPPSSPFGGGNSLPMTAQSATAEKSLKKDEPAGLGKVAIGHGEVEGVYREGSNYRNKRAEEPIRVTVVYFVTPKGEITHKDMENFTKAFESWDGQAIWGGSFVTKEEFGQ